MGKTAMISQPMRGKTEEEILAVRDKAKQELEGMGYDVLYTYYKFELPWHIKNESLYCLGESLIDMAYCDAVYFCHGWADTRGCLIEHKVAEVYGIERIYEE